jgi:hypothetical protein
LAKCAQSSIGRKAIAVDFLATPTAALTTANDLYKPFDHIGLGHDSHPAEKCIIDGGTKRLRSNTSLALFGLCRQNGQISFTRIRRFLAAFTRQRALRHVTTCITACSRESTMTKEILQDACRMPLMSPLPDEYFVLQMDGRLKSQHRRFVDALRAGLLLRDRFRHRDIKVRAIVSEHQVV